MRATTNERDREAASLCVALFVVIFAVGIFCAIHVGIAELATRDAHPPPSCQHFPTSSRCIQMELNQCMDECKAPKLAVYIGRHRATNVLTNAAFYALEWIVESDSDSSEASRERKLRSNVFHGASVIGELLTTERTHAARCMAACLVA